MRLITYRDNRIPDAGESLGVMVSDPPAVLPLQRTAARFEIEEAAVFDSMLTYLSRGAEAAALAARVVMQADSADVESLLCPLEHVVWCAPVPVPNSIRDCMEFERHLDGSAATALKWRSRLASGLDRLSRRWRGRGIVPTPKVWFKRPVYYKGNRRSVVGHEAEVPWPKFARRLDFELEFGVFVAAGGRDLSVNQAERCIGGYALFNDFSAREIQLEEMQARLGPAKGKDFDRGNAIGPWLVTPDEIDERALQCEVHINGECWAKTSSAEMKFSFAEMLSFISQDETLYPGDFIGSGTLPNGCGLELDRWLQVGDVVELHGGPLGVLRNRIGENP